MSATTKLNLTTGIVYLQGGQTIPFAGITVDDGTAAAPSIAFTSQPGLGYFRLTADAIGVAGNNYSTSVAAMVLYAGATQPGLYLPTSGVVAWSGTSNPFAAATSFLVQDAANTLALRNGGTSGSPVAQTLRLYQYYTDSTHNHGLEFSFNSAVPEIKSFVNNGAVSSNIRLISQGGGDVELQAPGGYSWALYGSLNGALSGTWAPGVDNTHDVGTTVRRVRSVFVGTQVIAPLLGTGGTLNYIGIQKDSTHGVTLDVATDTILKVFARDGSSAATVAANQHQTLLALITAVDGGSTAAFTANMVGSTGGPTTAAQNGWMKMIDSTGATVWVPVWK